MGKYKTILEQHTSLIHFQSEQPGATIRATEVKPKLDKYIIDNCFKDSKLELKKFVIQSNGETKQSLNYKMKINTIDNKYISEEISGKFPCFFANLKNNKNTQTVVDEKKFIWNEKISLEIFSYDKEILNIIIAVVPKFLRETNFGMRQSKGFGCFYINAEGRYELDGNEFIYKPEQLDFEDSWYRFDIEKKSIQNPFVAIDLFYSTLRSGINCGEVFYFKSLIADYAYSKGIQWEKKTIKEEFFSAKKSGKSNKKMVKDILGLSTYEKWAYQDANITKVSEEIKRFKSPIIFKPIKLENSYAVYFKALEYNKEILNHEFEISNKKNNKKFKLNTIENFDFEDFFRYVINIDLEEHIRKYDKNERVDQYLKHSNYNEIKRIYDSIRGYKGVTKNG